MATRDAVVAIVLAVHNKCDLGRLRIHRVL